MSTLHDVASVAGVSVTTASRVLRGKASALVSMATSERVKDAAEQLGYRASAAARALVTGRAQTVALCCHRAYDPDLARILRLTHNLVHEAGYHLMVVAQDTTAEVSALLREQRADAVIWTRYPVHEADALGDSLGAPHQVIIAIGEIADGGPQRAFSGVWEDREGMRRALEHLVGLGHGRVAYLGGLGGDSKQLAFEQACADLSLDGVVIAGAGEADRLAAGAAMARQVLKLRERPTALVARNDDFAIGALHALREAGLILPGDMSVIGYDDTPGAGYAAPPLTSVRTPGEEALQALLPPALAALDHDPDEREAPLHMRFEVALSVRKSTGPPRGNPSGKG